MQVANKHLRCHKTCFSRKSGESQPQNCSACRHVIAGFGHTCVHVGIAVSFSRRFAPWTTSNQRCVLFPDVGYVTAGGFGSLVLNKEHLWNFSFPLKHSVKIDCLWNSFFCEMVKKFLMWQKEQCTALWITRWNFTRELREKLNDSCCANCRTSEFLNRAQETAQFDAGKATCCHRQFHMQK